MTRLGRTLLAGLLVTSLAATGVLAETEVCVAVADDQAACPRVPEPDLTPQTVDQELAAAPLEIAPADEAPVDQPTITTTTRTIGPPAVVQGFGALAAPQSAAVEQPLVRIRQPDQKLPPGPPNRFP